MTCLDAVRIVLEQAGQPLHYKRIAEKVQKQGLVRIRGRRPDRSVNARLSADIIKFGDDSRFVRVAAGLFGLRDRGDESVLHRFDALVDDLKAAQAREMDRGPKDIKMAVLTSFSETYGDIVEMKLITRQVEKLRERWAEIGRARAHARREEAMETEAAAPDAPVPV